MEPLIIEKTKQTPAVVFKYGLIQMQGRSIPEDPIAFYQPLYDWIDLYVLDPSDETLINIDIDLMNTGSSKCILDFLMRLNKAYKNNSHMKINWHYDSEDEDMLQMGQDLRSFLEIPFEFVENAAA